MTPELAGTDAQIPAKMTWYPISALQTKGVWFGPG